MDNVARRCEYNAQIVYVFADESSIPGYIVQLELLFTAHDLASQVETAIGKKVLEGWSHPDDELLDFLVECRIS